jgi:hypothetical protein
VTASLLGDGKDDWMRDGRGRHWEFDLPTDALRQALQQVATKRNDRFELLSCFRERNGPTWSSLYEPQSLHQLSLDGPWQYFVRSLTLTPAIPEPEPLPGVGWPAVFATSGLVVLHHPDHARKTAPGRSSIGIVNRVRNQSTGEIVEHREYDSVFMAMKRALQKR